MNKAYLEGLVNQLNYNWFLEKKKFFQKENSYDKGLDIIKDAFDNTYSDDFKTNPNENFIEISVDLSSYCWSSYFMGSSVQPLEDEQRLYYGIPIDASDISSDIVDYISFTTSNYTEILAIHKFILNIIDNINVCTSALSNKLSVSDDDYSNCLLYFQSKTRREISKKFGHISQQVSYLNSKDALEFNLGQEELAALLLILNNASFLNTSNVNDTSFLHFCTMYFKFKYRGSFKHPNSFNNLSKKYNELKNKENPSLLEDIIKRLKAAMDTL